MSSPNRSGSRPSFCKALLHACPEETFTPQLCRRSSSALLLFILLTFNFLEPVGLAASGPAIPYLSSPGDGASLPAGQASVGLVWTSVKGATYDLEVGISCGDTSIANWNQKDPSSKVSGLKNGITYFWRVRSVSGKLKSAFPKCRTFSVQSPPPLVPSLSSPGDGASLPAGQASVGLVWTSVKGATYDLEVGISCGDTSIANWNQKDPSSKVSGLKNGTKYSWRVRSVGVGNMKSAFTNCRSFSAQNPPQATKLSKPADSATLPAGETKVTLEWISVKGATYDVIVGTSCGDTSIAKWNQQDTSAKIAGLKDGTRYYWSVQSSTAEGSKSGFPECRSFTVQSKPPTIELTVKITIDGAVSLIWKSTDATSCAASGNGWGGAKRLSGTETFRPQTTLTYDLECKGSGGRALKSVSVYTVNGRPLTHYQVGQLQFIAKQVVPDLDPSGPVGPNDIAARVAWWALSEGIIGETTASKVPIKENLNTHSNCNDRPTQLSVLESCPRNLLWQVGLAGVQAGHHDEAEIDRIIQKLWGSSKNRSDLLNESVSSKYSNLDAKTRKAIIGSPDDYLKRSWLLRHPAIGFMAEHNTLISTKSGGCALDSTIPKCTGENKRPGGVFVKWFAATPSDVRRSLADLSDLLLMFAVP